MTLARHLVATVMLVGLTLVFATAASARVNPPPGTVTPGEELMFSASLNDPVFDVKQDSRAGCAEQSDVAPLLYVATFEVLAGEDAPGLNAKIALSASDGIGGFSFSFVVPGDAEPGDDFVVNLSVDASCLPLSVYHATAQWGKFTVGAAPVTAADEVPEGMSECLPPVLAGIRSVRVFLQERRGRSADSFVQACTEARAVAQGQKIAGVRCASPAAIDAGERFVLCTGPDTVIVVAPARTAAGPTACKPVTYQGRRYLVFRRRVLCADARVTALRMLRRDVPYSFQLETPVGSRAWKCRILGRAELERGACFTSLEGRWLLYLLAPT